MHEATKQLAIVDFLIPLCRSVTVDDLISMSVVAMR